MARERERVRWICHWESVPIPERQVPIYDSDRWTEVRQAHGGEVHVRKLKERGPWPWKRKVMSERQVFPEGAQYSSEISVPFLPLSL